jgi:hypothetical protein
VLREQSRDFRPLIMSRFESNSNHSGIPQLLRRLGMKGDRLGSWPKNLLDILKLEGLPACFHRARMRWGMSTLCPVPEENYLRSIERQKKAVNLRW